MNDVALWSDDPFAAPALDPNPLVQACRLKTILLAHACGKDANDREFQALRQALMADSQIKKQLPDFLHYCRALDEFWSFIKDRYSGSGCYEARRQFLHEAFEPVLALLEQGLAGPAHEAMSATLDGVDSVHVREAWRKALDRRLNDPDGAITSARSLLEAVCKHILDHHGVAYSDEDLPRLYRLVAEQLRLAPNQQTEESFKKIFGCCQTVVQELGVVRNRVGDAHGKGKHDARAAARHAELAVNLAGAMAIFLIATWEDQVA